MSDLTDFLRARLDEEAARAEAATHGPWRADLDEDLVLAGDEVVARMWDFNRAGTAVQCAADTMTITIHADPTRVLAEVEAWRVVLEQARYVDDASSDSMVGTIALDAILSAKAAVYSNHPDYKEKWANVA